VEKTYQERHPEHALYNEDTAKSLLEIAKQEYQKEFDRRDTLDAKATTLLGFCGVIATLVAGAGALVLGSSELGIAGTTRTVFSIFYTLGVLAFVAAAVMCLIVYLPRDYQFVDLIKTVDAKYFKKPDTEFMVTMSETYRNMKNKDYKMNDNKYTFLKWSFGLIGLGLLMVLCETFTIAMATIF
jgi:hypothetical protein